MQAEMDTEQEPQGDTTLAALAHASALVASFLGPLLFLILADEGDELVEQNAKNSLNFQIIVAIAFAISFALTLVLIGVLLLPIVGIVDFILVILATIKANDGEVYSYPLTPSIV
jgi:uncharacterized Tic20 family protein